MKENWLVCRKISDFGLVCRGSKSLGITALQHLVQQYQSQQTVKQ
jgi:hypothetical protein